MKRKRIVILRVQGAERAAGRSRRGAARKWSRSGAGQSGGDVNRGVRLGLRLGLGALAGASRSERSIGRAAGGARRRSRANSKRRVAGAKERSLPGLARTRRASAPSGSASLRAGPTRMLGLGIRVVLAEGRCRSTGTSPVLWTCVLQRQRRGGSIPARSEGVNLAASPEAPERTLAYPLHGRGLPPRRGARIRLSPEARRAQRSSTCARSRGARRCLAWRRRGRRLAHAPRLGRGGASPSSPSASWMSFQHSFFLLGSRSR